VGHQLLQSGIKKIELNFCQKFLNQAQPKMDDPKTRREKKGRDKTKTNTVYSAKHIREQERLQNKRQDKQKEKTPNPKK